MTVYNLVTHDVLIYREDQFVNLEQVNQNSWVADDVFEKPIKTYLQSGTVLRINILNEESIFFFDEVVPINLSKYVSLVFITKEGEEKITEETIKEEDLLIVSLKTLENAKEIQHVLLKQMYSPFMTVRKRDELSKVLGCVKVTR